MIIRSYAFTFIPLDMKIYYNKFLLKKYFLENKNTVDIISFEIFTSHEIFYTKKLNFNILIK